MKKIISFTETCKINNAYHQKAAFELPGINKRSLCKIEFINLSEKIQNQGLFYEGKSHVNQKDSYFHWFGFDPKEITFELNLDPKLEKMAAVQNKKIPQGMYSSSEFDKLGREMKLASGYNFFEAIGLGKNEAALIQEANAAKNLILLSDFSNYPYNAGFFLIKNGRMLANGKAEIKDGKYWFAVKAKDSHKLSFQILNINNGAIKENIENFDFAFNLNPIIVGKKIMTDLTDIIPGTKETLIHSFRGGLSHIFTESVFAINKKIVEMMNQSQYKIAPKLKDMLKEKNNLIAVNNLSKEKLNDVWNWSSGHFQYKPGNPKKLKTGEYYFDQRKNIFSTCLKRNTYGHTMFAITKLGKIIVYKVFNDQILANNGLYLEQLGASLTKISKTIFCQNKINDQIIFAGVGANGKDVRTFLGLGPNPGYKNQPEDNPKINLQKISERPSRPLYFKVLKK